MCCGRGRPRRRSCVRLERSTGSRSRPPVGGRGPSISASPLAARQRQQAAGPTEGRPLGTGSTRPSFYPIVAAGPHSPPPRRRRIAAVDSRGLRLGSRLALGSDGCTRCQSLPL